MRYAAFMMAVTFWGMTVGLFVASCVALWQGDWWGLAPMFLSFCASAPALLWTGAFIEEFKEHGR